MATILLKDTYRPKFYETCVLRLERGKSVEVNADLAVSYLGVDCLEVTLSKDELNGLSDKKLNNALNHLKVDSKEDLSKAIVPKVTVTQTVTSVVTSTVKAVTPTLNKKVVNEEISDKAILAEESE